MRRANEWLQVVLKGCQEFANFLIFLFARLINIGWSMAKALIYINPKSPRPVSMNLRNHRSQIEEFRLQHSGPSGNLFQGAKAVLQYEKGQGWGSGEEL